MTAWARFRIPLGVASPEEYRAHISVMLREALKSLSETNVTDSQIVFGPPEEPGFIRGFYGEHTRSEFQVQLMLYNRIEDYDQQGFAICHQDTAKSADVERLAGALREYFETEALRYTQLAKLPGTEQQRAVHANPPLSDAARQPAKL